MRPSKHLDDPSERLQEVARVAFTLLVAWGPTSLLQRLLAHPPTLVKSGQTAVCISDTFNLGHTDYGTAALADADPLGVNQNVTFDEVGGLDDREYYQILS